VIWHLLEIWLALFLAFILGCGLGSLLYAGFARSPLADAQGRVADAIGDAIDGMRVQLGMAPAWTHGYRRPAERFDVEFAAPRPGFRQGGEGAVEVLPAPVEAAVVEARRGAAGPDRVLAPAASEAEAEWPEEAVGVVEAAGGPVVAAPPPPRKPPAPELPSMRPAGLAAPRNGVPDDLQRIRGIGRRNEELLNALGIFHFSQIAAWTPAEVRWVGHHLAFPERIERDDWIGQATILGSGGDTGYVKADRRRAEDEVGEEQPLPEE
jgi:predicted flap endonuclease-1-like 5' DNA nuclease